MELWDWSNITVNNFLQTPSHSVSHFWDGIMLMIFAVLLIVYYLSIGDIKQALLFASFSCLMLSVFLAFGHVLVWSAMFGPLFFLAICVFMIFFINYSNS